MYNVIFILFFFESGFARLIDGILTLWPSIWNEMCVLWENRAANNEIMKMNFSRIFQGAHCIYFICQWEKRGEETERKINQIKRIKVTSLHFTSRWNSRDFPHSFTMTLLELLNLFKLTFACELSIMLSRALVTAYDTLDILIFHVRNLSSVGTSYWRRSWCGRVVIVGRRVIVVIIGASRCVGREWSICVMHAIRCWTLLHWQQVTLCRCRLWQ